MTDHHDRRVIWIVAVIVAAIVASSLPVTTGMLAVANQRLVAEDATR